MPERYEILIRRSAEKEIEALPREARVRVIEAIRALAGDPRPHGCEKMARASAWRIRCGRYRVVYTIVDERLVIEIVKVGHRREVYRHHGRTRR